MDQLNPYAVELDQLTGQPIKTAIDPFTGEKFQVKESQDNLYSNTGISSTFGMQAVGGDVTDFQDRGLNISATDDLLELRAKGQSGWDQFANGIIKAVGTFGTAVIDNTAGYAVGLLDYALSGGEDFTESMSNNAVSKYLTGPANEMLRREFPNFKTREEQDAVGTLKGLASVNFWADEFANGLAYSAGSIASMALTGGTGIATQGVKALTKLPGLVKAGSKAAAVTGLGASVNGVVNTSRLASLATFGTNVGKRVATGAAVAERGLNMSMAEAGLEAREAKELAKEQYIDELKQKKLEQMNAGRSIDEQYSLDDVVLSPEDYSKAELAAEQVERLTFYGNMAVLAPTNAIAFFKPLSKMNAATKPRSIVRGADGQFTDAVNAIKSPLLKRVVEGSRYLANPLRTMPTEAFQEYSQYGITESALEYESAKMHDSGAADLIQGMSRLGVMRDLANYAPDLANQLVDQIEDPEAIHQAMIGALVGGVSGAYHSRSTVRDKDKATQRAADLANLDPVFSRLADKAQFTNTESYYSSKMTAADQAIAEVLKRKEETTDPELLKVFDNQIKYFEGVREDARTAMSLSRAQMHIENNTDEWYRQDLMGMHSMSLTEFKKAVGIADDSSFNEEDKQELIDEQIKMLDAAKRATQLVDKAFPRPEYNQGKIAQWFQKDETLQRQREEMADHERYRTALIFSQFGLTTVDERIKTAVEELRKIFPDLTDEQVEKINAATRKKYGTVEREDGKEFVRTPGVEAYEELENEILKSFATAVTEQGKEGKGPKRKSTKKADLEKRRQEELDKKTSNKYRRIERERKALEPNQEAPLNVGDRYDEGMKVSATFTAEDENVEGEGYQMITGIRKPQINTDGVMTQSGEVIVGVFKDKASADKWLEEDKKKLEDLSNKRAEEINAKYAAELAELEKEVEENPITNIYGPLIEVMVRDQIEIIKRLLQSRDEGMTAYNNLVRDPKQRDLYLSRLKAKEEEAREKASKDAVDNLINSTKTAEELSAGRKAVEATIPDEYKAKYQKILDAEHKKRMTEESKAKEDAAKKAARRRGEEQKSGRRKKKAATTETKGKAEQDFEEAGNVVTATRTTSGSTPSGQFRLVADPNGDTDNSGNPKYHVVVTADGRPVEGDRNKTKTVNGEPVINARHLLATPEIQSGTEVGLKVIETDWWKQEGAAEYSGREAEGIPIFITYNLNGEEVVIGELGGGVNSTRIEVFEAFNAGNNGVISTVVETKGSGYVFTGYETKNGVAVKPYFYSLQEFDNPIVAIARIDDETGEMILDLGDIESNDKLTEEEVKAYKKFAAVSANKKFAEGQVVLVEKNAMGEFIAIPMSTAKISDKAIQDKVLELMATNDSDALERLVGVNSYYHFENPEDRSDAPLFIENLTVNGEPLNLYIFKPLQEDGTPIGLPGNDFVRISDKLIARALAGEQLTKESLSEIEYDTFIVRLQESEEGGINMKGTTRRYNSIPVKDSSETIDLVDPILENLEQYLRNLIAAKRFQVSVDRINGASTNTFISPIDGTTKHANYIDYLSSQTQGTGQSESRPILGSNVKRVNQVNGKGGSVMIDIGLELKGLKIVSSQPASADAASNAQSGKKMSGAELGGAMFNAIQEAFSPGDQSLMDEIDALMELSPEEIAKRNQKAMEAIQGKTETGTETSDTSEPAETSSKEKDITDLAQGTESKEGDGATEDDFNGRPFSLKETTVTSRQEMERRGEEIKKKCKGL